MAKKVLIVSTSLVADSGITDSNDASNHKDTMQKDYELGKGL